MSRTHTVSCTCDSSGDLTTYTASPVNGYLHAVRVVVPASGGIASGTDITITVEDTGEAILAITNQGAASASYYPRAQVCGPTATALTYDGTRTVNERICIAQSRVKVVIAQGGSLGACTIYFVVGS